MRSVTTFTTGVSGSGKTLIRCSVFLRRDFLRHQTGVHVSNFPIGVVPPDHLHPPRHRFETFRHRIALDVCKGDRRAARRMRRRMRVIPEAVLEEWRAGTSGPWDYFAGDEDRSGWHFALDECHVYLDKKSPDHVLKRWQRFIGDLRHRGMSAEFLTQTPRKVALDINAEAGSKIAISSKLEEREPLFGIPFYDLFQLVAKFVTREFHEISRVVYYADNGSTFDKVGGETVKLHPKHFRFYDSNNKPAQGGVSGKRDAHPCERLGPLALIAWFIRRNWERMFFKVGAGASIAALAVVLTLFHAPIWTAVKPAAVAAWHWWTAPDPPAETVPARPPVQVAGLAPAPSPPPPLPPPPGRAGYALGQPATRHPDPEPIPEGHVTIHRSELAALRAELEDLRRFRLEVLRAADEASTLSLIGPDYAVFRDGSRYSPGQRIQWGPFAGRVVESVDPAARSVVLDGGDVLRLGVVGLRRPEGVPPAGPAP